MFCTSLQDENNISTVIEIANNMTDAPFESTNKRKRSEDNHLSDFNSAIMQVKHNSLISQVDKHYTKLFLELYTKSIKKICTSSSTSVQSQFPVSSYNL
jgi:hypothetical protein